MEDALDIITNVDMLPKPIQKFCILENLIFGATEEDIEEATKITLENEDIPKDSIYPLIVHAAHVRPFTRHYNGHI